MERTIFHIDVNSAFLSWEAARQLREGKTEDLRLIPSAVCGDTESRRGVILAKSIPAKKYGIVTGEPVVSAMRKCPFLLRIPPDFKLYRDSSERLFRILGEYSDRLEKYSIDECFLDYTGMERLFGEPWEAAWTIKERIKEELGFTVNIGISTNKLLAKMAGDLKKPDLVHTLYLKEIEEKMWPLPVESLFMVGRRTAPRLRRMGITTIGDLAVYNQSCLIREFKSFGYQLHAYANGEDASSFSAGGESGMKSISNSTTLPADVRDCASAEKILLSLSESVAQRMREEGVSAQEIAVAVKTSDFRVYSHQKQLYSATDCTNMVYEKAREIFREMWRGEPVRLLGVRASRLCGSQCVQLSLLDGDFEKQRKADKAMDQIRLKYGKEAVMRSTFLHSEVVKEDGEALKVNQKAMKDN